MAIGFNAGQISQGGSSGNAIAIGSGAGQYTQGGSSIAIGFWAGRSSQKFNSIAIGISSANANQGSQAVAIGYQAGYTGQGGYGIAIGSEAGKTNQPNNSIVINATTTPLSGATASAFYVAPIRNTTSTSLLYYNSSTSEIVHSSTSSLSVGTLNATSGYQKNGTGIVSLAEVSFNVAMTSSQAEYYVSLPSPVTIYNFVSIAPFSGTNDIVYLYYYALGFWSGVQNPNEIRISCRLGNAVASNIGTFKIFYSI